MKVTTKSAQDAEHGESLEQVKQRFALWREQRKRGEHVTGALWDAAVRMAERHGLLRTAQELRVDSGRLTKRLERGAALTPDCGPGPRFVECRASGRMRRRDGEYARRQDARRTQEP
jgi:hypothetical protein